MKRGWRGPKIPGEYPTIGYGILDWGSAYIPSPSDPEGRKRIEFTDEQAGMVLRIYALDPVSGLPLVRRTTLEEAKGWGKSPFAAFIALASFCGPVVFDGWDANGEPVGRPWGTVEGSPPPWVQIAAVSEEQTDNTYSAVYAMLTANAHKAAIDLRIDEGRTRLYLRDIPGSKFEPVTASFGSREGQRTTDAILDETHLWNPRNGGVKLARTIRRNVGKMNGRTLETTNAPVLGEKSVAEQTSEDSPEPGVLHFANRPTEVPSSDWSDEKLLEQLSNVYRDASWVSLPRQLAEARDTATDWQDSLRFYFNVRTTGSGRAVDPRVWDLLARPGDQPPAGAYIGAGFDGSVSRDGTVLMGCTPEGRSFLIDRWSRPQGAPHDWTVPRLEVHAAVARMFDRWKVGKFVCDPPFWRTEVEGWELQYGEEVVEMLDTNQGRRFAPAVDRWLTGIREGTHTHDGDQFVSDNVKSAHLRKFRDGDGDDDARTMYVLVKGEEGRRIDAAVADVLAYEAAMTMPAVPEAPSYFSTIETMAEDDPGDDDE